MNYLHQKYGKSFFLLIGLGFATFAWAQETNERTTTVIHLESRDPDFGILAPKSFGGFDFNRDFLRGFGNESALRDGHRDYGYLGAISFTNIESVEILKGPNSALYGNGKPGGDLSTNTKQADGNTFTGATLEMAQYGFARAKVDSGGRLGNDSAYRFTAAGTNGHTFRDKSSEQQYFVAPVIKARLDASTEFNISAEFAESRLLWDINFIPDARLTSLSVRRFLGEPGNRLTISSQTLRTSIDHNLSSSTSLRQAFFMQNAQNGHRGATYDIYGFGSNSPLSADGLQVNRVIENQSDSHNFQVSQTELSTTANILGTKHSLLIGVEIAHFNYKLALGLGNIAPISINAPQYGAPLSANLSPVADQSYGTHTQVLYFVDRFDLPQNGLKALFGLRAERSTNYLQDKLVGSPEVRQVKTIHSPRIGLVWQASPALDIFTSWTNSARPQIGARSATGNLFRPEEGTQIEGGIQYRSKGNTTISTLSLFEIHKRNVLTTNPANPNFQIDSGQRESRGVEYDLINNTTWGSLNASISYTNAYVSRDESIPAGSPLAGVPRWAASAYSVINSPMDIKHLSMSFGLYTQSQVQTTLPNNVLTLPGYCTTNLSLSYKMQSLTIQANLNNIANHRILKSDGYGIYPDEPRKLELILSYRF